MPPTKEEGRLKRALAWPSKFLFGDDIFISYSRADGATYAEGVGEALTARGFTCRLDLWGTESGAEMPRSLQKALRRSAVLILVGTKGAARSRHVAMEVAVARRLDRKIVPIVFDGVLLRNGFTSRDGRLVKADDALVGDAEALWAADIEGLPISCEKTEALETGDPSDGLETGVPGAKPEKVEPPVSIVKRVEKTHTFKRKDERLRLATRVTAALLLVLIGASVVAAVVAKQMGEEAAQKTAAAQAAEKRAGAAESKAKEQEEKARLETARAEAAMTTATNAERVAGEKTKLAEEAAQRADEQTHRADEQTRRAEAASRRAAEQEANAHRNLARSFYAQAQADSATDPLRSLAWVDSAVREAPATDENLSAYVMRAVNLAAGAPLSVVNAPAGVDSATVSPDGLTMVTVTETSRFSVWDARTGAPLPHPLPDPNVEYLSKEGNADTPVFSLDGRRVALLIWTAETPGEQREPHLLIWEARTGKTVRNIPLEDWGAEMSFSPDGAQFIIRTANEEGMCVWDVASGERIEYAEPADVPDVTDSTPAGGPRFSQNPARNWFLEVTTDESRATAKNEHGEEVETDILQVREIKTGAVVRELILLDKKHVAPEHVRFAEFTRDAQRVVVISEAGERRLLRVWNVVSGHVNEPVALNKQEGETDQKKDDKKGEDESMEGKEEESQDDEDDGGEVESEGATPRLYIEDKRSISPDGRSLLLVRSDGGAVGVEVWDISGDAPTFSSFHPYDKGGFADVGNYFGGRTKTPEFTIYADDGEHVIDVSALSAFEREQEVTVWNLQTGLLLSRPLLIPDGAKLFNVSARDQTAGVFYRDGTVLTYDLTRNGPLDAAKLKRAPAGVKLMLVAPGRGEVLTEDNGLALRDAENWAVKWRSDVRRFLLFQPKFSSDGTRFALLIGFNPLLHTTPGTLQVYRASDGAAEPGFRPIAVDRNTVVEFSRDGNELVTKTSGSLKGDAIRRWSAKTGEPRPGPNGELASKDGTFLGFTRYGEFCMTLPPLPFPGISLGNYTELTLRRVDEELTPVTRLRFAEHGTAALAAALFRSAKEIRPAGPDAVVAVLDSGVEISAAATPEGAALTNERTKRRLMPPLDSTADLSALVVSPDGRLLAAPIRPNASVGSSLWDAFSKRTFVRVWDAATGLPLSDRLWHEDALKSLAFSPDSRRLMTATEHGMLREWFFGDFAGGAPVWAARMGEALGGMRVAKGLDAQRLPAEEHTRSRREFEAALKRASDAGDEAARFLLATLKR